MLQSKKNLEFFIASFATFLFCMLLASCFLSGNKDTQAQLEKLQEQITAVARQIDIEANPENKARLEADMAKIQEEIANILKKLINETDTSEFLKNLQPKD